MRHLAITGMETAAMISRIFLGEAMRATPPSARICAGTRSRAITATAPAFSAMEACSALVTSMMTPPLSISASPVLRRRLVLLPLFWDMGRLFSGKTAFSYQLSAFGEPAFILQRVHNLRYPKEQAIDHQLSARPAGCAAGQPRACRELVEGRLSPHEFS